MALLREGLTRLLADAGFDIAGGTGDLPGLLELVDNTAPDAALIDIKMPPTFTDEGLRAATLIRQRHPRTAVLLLSSYLESRYASADSSRRVLAVLAFLQAWPQFATASKA